MHVFIKVLQVLNQKTLSTNINFLLMLSAEKISPKQKASIPADHFIRIIISSILQYFLIGKIYEHY